MTPIMEEWNCCKFDLSTDFEKKDYLSFDQAFRSFLNIYITLHVQVLGRYNDIAMSCHAHMNHSISVTFSNAILLIKLFILYSFFRDYAEYNIRIPIQMYHTNNQYQHNVHV